MNIQQIHFNYSAVKYQLRGMTPQSDKYISYLYINNKEYKKVVLQ